MTNFFITERNVFFLEMEFHSEMLPVHPNLNKRKFQQPLSDQTLAKVKVKGDSQHHPHRQLL